MKKRFLKIAALVVALLLIVGVCAFANSLVGNPISKALARKTAEAHLQTAYEGEELELETVTFSFKDRYYHAYITAPNHVDGDFSLLIDMWGKLRIDTYADRVAGGWNTADRIRTEYRKHVDTVLHSPAFPYTAYIGYGDIEFISREYKDAPTVPSYAIVTEELTAGAFYDSNEFGARAGKLTIYVDDNTVSAERLAEILLGIKEVFDNTGVKFYAIDCILAYPPNENGIEEGDRVEVMDFLYSDIYEEGLVERVKASDEAARFYYTEQDAEKLMDEAE